MRVIIGGEVDCVLCTLCSSNVVKLMNHKAQADKSKLTTNDFVELKTSVVIASKKAEERFERCVC